MRRRHEYKTHAGALRMEQRLPFQKKGALKKEKGGLKKIPQAAFFHFGQLWLPWPFGQMDKQGPQNACPPFQ